MLKGRVRAAFYHCNLISPASFVIAARYNKESTLKGTKYPFLSLGTYYS
jgi:hypothetical protein